MKKYIKIFAVVLLVGFFAWLITYFLTSNNDTEVKQEKDKEREVKERLTTANTFKVQRYLCTLNVLAVVTSR